jgi:F-type H+-transporting ATPase subunit delta
MHRAAHHSPLASAYASSLLELANEANQPEQIAAELDALRTIVTDAPTFALFLSDPSINETERAGVITRTFAGKLSGLMMNFLGVLNLKGRLGTIGPIADAYDDLLDEQLGKIEVDVTVAQKLSADQLEQVRQKVSAALNKDAVLHQYVDESIIGGMVLRVQDKLIDASVRTQLSAMREQMLAAGPK